MKDKILWWSTLILVWLVFVAVSIILIFTCVPLLMINELNIGQKTMMILGFITCEYGLSLILEAMVEWAKKKMRNETKE